MRTGFKMILSFLCLVLFFSSQAQARVLFSDNFNNHPDWDGRINTVNQLTGENIGNWTYIWHSPQTDLNFGSVSAANRYGSSGKGFRFKISTNGGAAPSAAQESCLFSSGNSLIESRLFWGYRWRCSSLNWGNGGKTLKMTRIYSGSNSVIPGWYDGPNALKIFYNGSYKPLSGQCYQLRDTNWHTYIWEFYRGSATGSNGVIRLWVDGTLEYEDTQVNWSDTGTVFNYDYFPMMQGNMSGNYNGGELYTYWDDYIWATTLDEVKAYLGVIVNQPSNSDTTPPSVPSGIQFQVR